jgi:hypothetical protein
MHLHRLVYLIYYFFLLSQHASQYNGSEDEKLLLDEAEQSYNRMIDAITNNCINGMQNETGPIYNSPQILDVNDGLSSVADNHKIFDTRNMSQVNFVYNNVTFQVRSNSLELPLVPKL